MNCKKVRELILTDYLDDQMSAREKEALEQHLAQCQLCKKLASNARKVGDELFADAGRIDPPEFIWHRIKRAVTAGQQKKMSFLENFWVRKQTFAVATALTLVLMIGVMMQFRINDQRALQAGLEDQVGYFADLTAGPADLSMEPREGLGTSVEEYFL